MRYAALLRGVNLGGHRRVAMADLRRVLESLGLGDVATYLQSGNAVFATHEPDRADLKKRIEGAIAAQLGIEVALVLVSEPELAAVVAANPYRAQAEADPTKVHVTFLQPMPLEDIWSKIEPASVAPEQFTVGAGGLYLHLPLGMGRANLPGLVAKAFSGVVATTRNWRTVVRLAAMLDEG